MVLREHEAKEHDDPKQSAGNGRSQARTGDRDRQHARRQSGLRVPPKLPSPAI
jgi:hypothetical protein